MSDYKENTIGGVLFILFIIFLIVGGFFLTKYLTSNNDTKQVEKNTDEYKVNKDYDYIYYDNESESLEGPDIVYKDVVINLSTAETLNNTLKSEMDKIRQSVKYINDSELDPEREVLYDANNIYSAIIRDYENYEYNEYISLVIKNSEYNCYDGKIPSSVKSYVYNTKNGKMVLNNELFDLYDITINSIKNKINDHLNDNQVVIDNNYVINIDETLSNLDDANNYALYIDKYGDLNISFIVKTNEIDYNDNIKIS